MPWSTSYLTRLPRGISMTASCAAMGVLLEEGGMPQTAYCAASPLRIQADQGPRGVTGPLQDHPTPRRLRAARPAPGRANVGAVSPDRPFSPAVAEVRLAVRGALAALKGRCCGRRRGAERRRRLARARRGTAFEAPKLGITAVAGIVDHGLQDGSPAPPPPRRAPPALGLEARVLRAVGDDRRAGGRRARSALCRARGCSPTNSGRRHPARPHARRPGRDRAPRARPRLGRREPAGHGGGIGPPHPSPPARRAPRHDPRLLRRQRARAVGGPPQRRPALRPRAGAHGGAPRARGAARPRRRGGAGPHRRAAAGRRRGLPRDDRRDDRGHRRARRGRHLGVGRRARRQPRGPAQPHHPARRRQRVRHGPDPRPDARGGPARDGLVGSGTDRSARMPRPPRRRAHRLRGAADGSSTSCRRTARRGCRRCRCRPASRRPTPSRRRAARR